jgi:hypothetical protein
MGAILWPFLIYWLVMFVSSYIIVDIGHDQLYDEPPPNEAARVLVGSLLLSALLTWTRPTFDTMFTSGLPWTVLQGIVWFLVFMFIYQFHPYHAVAIGVVAMLLIPGVASMGVESLTKPTPTVTPARTYRNQKAFRGTMGPAPAAKGQTPAAK